MNKYRKDSESAYRREGGQSDMEKQDIKSMTQEELRAFLVSLGEKPFRTGPDLSVDA